MVIKRGEHRLKPRQMGVALTATAEGEFGRALFEKEPGSGVYYEFEIKAIEYVREHHEVWVIDNDNGITEHTPQELRSETVGGVPYRVTDVNPLPVTMSKDGNVITFVTIKATASGNTKIVEPNTGKKIRVTYFSYANKHTTLADVGMRFGDTGDIKHRVALAANGLPFNANLLDCNWEGEADEVLNAYCDGAYTDGVYFTVGYKEVD